jgi:hypothetical protein
MPGRTEKTDDIRLGLPVERRQDVEGAPNQGAKQAAEALQDLRMRGPRGPRPDNLRDRGRFRLTIPF